MTTLNQPLIHHLIVQAHTASVLPLTVYDLARPSQSAMSMRTCNQ